MVSQYRSLAAIILVAFTIACTNPEQKPAAPNPPAPPASSVPLINYAVAGYMPHDTSLFTEGFLFHNGHLFESTGSPEESPDLQSVVGIIDPHTGKMDEKIRLDREKYFGEGITFLNGKLYQLTYKNQKGFIYDAATYKKIGEFTYANQEGWSLTTDGRHLIMSDGTDTLTYLDPVTCKPIKTLKVTLNGIKRDSLNELEYIKGYIYANIWITNNIVKIDTATGKVVGMLDMRSLVDDARNRNPNADVLNGIAYDSATDKIYVVGKQWANIYQISFPH